MSDAIPLPSHPDPDFYRKLARELLRTSLSEDPVGLERWAARWMESLGAAWTLAEDALRRVTPGTDPRARVNEETRRLERAARAANIVKLAEAQFFLARIHGFASWPGFVHHLEALRNSGSQDANFEAAAEAIVSGDLTTLVRLLAEDPSLVSRRSGREHRSTLLHYVSANGIEDFRQKTPPNIAGIARVLLDAGADVNAESDAYAGHSTTLLLTATSLHPEEAGVQIELLELLLESGARIDRDGVNACLANGRAQAAEFLARRGAPLNLEAAAGIGRMDVVDRLVPGAAPQERERGFLFACQFGHIAVARLLLERGVEPDAADRSGMTGLHWAAHEAHLDIIRLLLDRGAPLETRNAWGGTVLGQAVWSAIHHRRPDHLGIIETLVDAGARVGDDWITGHRDIDEALGKRKR